jgi:hypothetical protein
VDISLNIRYILRGWVPFVPITVRQHRQFPGN